jgi:hypothetical protein
MHTTRITVLHNGKPFKGATVRLSFRDFIFVTHPAHTDTHGVAVIGHRNRGKADIIINARRYVTEDLPGNVTVEVS